MYFWGNWERFNMGYILAIKSFLLISLDVMMA